MAQGAIKDVTKDDVVRIDFIGRNVVWSRAPPAAASVSATRQRCAQGGKNPQPSVLRRYLVRHAPGRNSRAMGPDGLGENGACSRRSLAWILIEARQLSSSQWTGSMVKIQPHKLLSHCGYITENRHADGLFLSQPVWRNITATALARYASKVLRDFERGRGS